MVTKFEAQKNGYRQTKEGIVISFLLHPNDVDAAFAIAPLGTVYAIGIVPLEAGTSPQPDAQDDQDADELEGAEVTQQDTAALRERLNITLPKSWTDISLAQQAGIRCNDTAFQHWLAVPDAAAAAEAVRKYCGVASRSELKLNTMQGAAWAHMDKDFQTHMSALATDQMAKAYTR